MLLKTFQNLVITGSIFLWFQFSAFLRSVCGFIAVDVTTKGNFTLVTYSRHSSIPLHPGENKQYHLSNMALRSCYQFRYMCIFMYKQLKFLIQLFTFSIFFWIFVLPKGNSYPPLPVYAKQPKSYTNLLLSSDSFAGFVFCSWMHFSAYRGIFTPLEEATRMLSLPCWVSRCQSPSQFSKMHIKNNNNG